MVLVCVCISAVKVEVCTRVCIAVSSLLVRWLHFAFRPQRWPSSHRSSVLHGCRLSATELFRYLLLVSGISASSLRVVFSRLKTHTFSRLFPGLLLWSDFCHYRTFLSLCYLLFTQVTCIQQPRWCLCCSVCPLGDSVSTW